MKKTTIKKSKIEKQNGIYFVIENNKEIDPRAFTLMGASTKRQDSSKIGFFGSGNKYAIALLMRENTHFKIFSGKKEIKFRKKMVNFEGQRYEVIVINGKETSLTTEMGPNWKDWFAVREFYSNALDEGEASFNVSDKFEPKAGTTKIYIEKTKALSDFFSNIQKYILTTNVNKIASVETGYGNVSLIKKMDKKNLVFYRKGIRIEERSEGCLYWYNFDRIEINESRTTKHSHEPSERIASFFANTTDEQIIRNFIHSYHNKYEEHLYWQYVGEKLSSSWEKVLRGKRVYPQSIATISGDFEGKANSVILPDKLAKKISKEIPTITVVGFSDEAKYEILDKTSQERELINSCLIEMKKFGYPYNGKVIIAKFYEDDVIGRWDSKNKAIVIARTHFPNSVDKLLNTMLEEYFHSKGQVDGQRSFVTFLIQEIIYCKRSKKIN